MANSFITIQEIARAALPRLIENLVFPNLVYKDFSNDFSRNLGDTIQVRKPFFWRQRSLTRVWAPPPRTLWRPPSP